MYCLARVIPLLLLGCLLAAPLGATAADGRDLTPYQDALTLKPDLENGRRLYINCVSCHGPEAWGQKNGTYPQIAGQLAGVIIKQLEDIRRGNRSNPIMRAFTSPRVLGGAQEIADVAGYVASLPMTRDNGRGNADLVDEGRLIYADKCKECHGDHAQGDTEDLAPLLYDQHFLYLKRQFDHIRKGLRRNADRKMTKQIMNFEPEQERAVLSFVSSLRPPKEKLAPSGWSNSDFPRFAR
jgi:cbb3-type cytochrome c oxidase subunit III